MEKRAWKHSFKWKPPEFNTIDFMVSTMKDITGTNDKIDSIFNYGQSKGVSDNISQYKTVVFVDANKTALKNGFSIERVFPSEKVSFSTHAVPPDQILNLCATIYHKKPISYLLKIEGNQWDFNLELTKKASDNLKKALLAFKAFTF